MKRRRREARNLNRRLMTARLAGRLVEASDYARLAGLDCHCEVSVDLWDSLFWRYPSAGPHDIVHLAGVLSKLRERLESEVFDQPKEMTIQVPCPTWWMGPMFLLKFVLVYQRDELDQIVVMPRQGTVGSLMTVDKPPPPATLLVKLLVACRSMHLVAHPLEQAAVNLLQDAICSLVRSSPLFVEIRGHLEKLGPPVVPYGFTPQEYRRVVCHDLFGLLEVAAAVTKLNGSDFRFPTTGILQLLAHQVGTMPLQDASERGEQSRWLH